MVRFKSSRCQGPKGNKVVKISHKGVRTKGSQGGVHKVELQQV